jgi:hypothetical protein
LKEDAFHLIPRVVDDFCDKSSAKLVGASGFYAAKIVMGFDQGLYPTMFLLLTWKI